MRENYISILLLFCVGLCAEVAEGTAQQTHQKLILVTGFEPFGERTENISWEAVKGLEQTTFGHYKIKVMKLPVVWGQPMSKIEQFIQEHAPVAVFSFGQGGPNVFKFEQVGLNKRKPYLDNKHARPEQLYVLKDGPDKYVNLLDVKELQHHLLRRGYPFSVSTYAGQYLCDECTYALLHLQQKYKLDAVGFFHIPPYDSPIVIDKQRLNLSKNHAADFARTVLQLYSKTLGAD